MDISRTGNAEFKRISVNLLKCDHLIKKCDEFQLPCDSVTSVERIRKSDAITDSYSVNFTPSKIMSISELFDIMITDARNMEPKQFCLPAEYSVNTDLNVPSTGCDINRSINETDGNDLIKLPPRKCYYCKKICPDDEIVSCDFCPGHFHVNCLNPPLCCTPDIKWMCPLHPHHFLSNIMARSYSITELTFWWNKIAVSCDDDTIEKDFIRKIRSLKKKQQQLRREASHSVRIRRPIGFQIPEIIKYHYEHSSTPSSILQEITNPRQHRRFRNSPLMIPRGMILRTKRRETKNGRSVLTTSENLKEEFHLRNTTLIEIISEDDSRNSGNSNTNLSAGSERSRKSEDFSLWDSENKRFKFTSNGIYDYDRLDELTIHKSFNQKTHPCEKNNASKTQIMSNPTLEYAEETNNRNRKNFSWSRVQQIINHNIENSLNEEKQLQDETELLTTLRKRLSESKLHSIICGYPPSFIPNTLPYPFYSSSVCEGLLLPNKPMKKVHAVLCPLSHQAPPIFMYDNTLKVGTDIRNDVYLMKYGTCEFVSDHHATIFYDEFTNVYELLNVSEYNCVIDGLCYTSTLLTLPKTNVCRWRNYSNDMNILLKEDCDRKVLPIMQMNGIEKLPKHHSKSSFTANMNKNKRFHSKITSREREWRYAHQKLLQEIEKLVTKSQKEMTSIANEDLNEISKILKNRKSTTVTSNKIEEVQQSPQTVFIIKRKRKMFPNQLAHLFLKNKKRNLEGKCAQGSLLQENPPFEVEEVAPVELPGNENERLNYDKPHLCSTTKRKLSKFHTVSIRGKQKLGLNKDGPKSTSINGSSTGDEESRYQGVYYHMEHVHEAHQVEEKCGCRTLNLKFPIGRDSSWEKSAPLHHGSHIRFGCIEFVFCIVNHSTTSEHMNESKEVVPSFERDDERPKMVYLDGELRRQTKDGDLSSKLASILTVLSSDSEVRNDAMSLTSLEPLSRDRESKRRVTAENVITSVNKSIGYDETNSLSSCTGSIDSASHYYDENEMDRKR